MVYLTIVQNCLICRLPTKDLRVLVARSGSFFRYTSLYLKIVCCSFCVIVFVTGFGVTELRSVTRLNAMGRDEC